MKPFFITPFLFFIFTSTNGQITKNSWLVGGSGTFSLQNINQTTNTAKASFIDLAPNIGYFFIDKMAGGMRVRFQNSRIKTPTSTSNSPTLAIGPYFRYYFLSKENRINLLSEIGYSYNDDLRNTSSVNTFNIAAGPVIYFNSTVGLEFTANYQVINFKPDNGNVKTFFISIGLQVHLEKEH